MRDSFYNIVVSSSRKAIAINTFCLLKETWFIVLHGLAELASFWFLFDVTQEARFAYIYIQQGFQKKSIPRLSWEIPLLKQCSVRTRTALVLLW